MGFRLKCSWYLLFWLQRGVADIAGHGLLRGSHLACHFRPVHLNETKETGAISVRRVCAGTAMLHDAQRTGTLAPRLVHTTVTYCPQDSASRLLQAANALFSLLSRTRNSHRRGARYLNFPPELIYSLLYFISTK